MHRRPLSPLTRDVVLRVQLIALLCIAACHPTTLGPPITPSESAPIAALNTQVEHRAITFTDAGLEFDAVIDAPYPAPQNARAVLLIGGGYGNDLDWTTPGSISVNEQPTRITLSGMAHADAPALSAALNGRGFFVMRWSTLARSDPLAPQWPMKSTPRSLTQLLDQTRAALAALRNSGLVDRDNIILLGHSLGAARACTIARDDPGISALVLLSPAYFTRADPVPQAFKSAGMSCAEDLLPSHPIPCLALFGSLDTSRAVNANAAATLANTPGFEHLTTTTFERLGHQLGPQDEQLTGPIDPLVLNRLADWAEKSSKRP